MNFRPCLCLVAAVVALAACTKSAGPTTGASPPTTKAASPTTADCPNPVANPVAGLRPPAALPAPGQMAAGSYLRTIQDRGRLVAGVSQETLGFGYLNPIDGQTEGFDIDVLHQISLAIFGDPNRIELRAITVNERIPKIVDGSVDIVSRTFTITGCRRTQVDFSTPVFIANARAVLVRLDSPATGLRDLGGKKVCATTGSTSIPIIEAEPVKPPPVAVALADFSACLVDFQNGEVDAISTDDALLAGLAAQDPYAKIVGGGSADPQPYGLGISLTHPELTRFVNGVLDHMRADGTWKALYTKWLQKLLKGPVPNPPAAFYKD